MVLVPSSQSLESLYLCGYASRRVTVKACYYCSGSCDCFLEIDPTPALNCSTFNISQPQPSTAQPSTSANPSPQLQSFQHQPTPALNCSFFNISQTQLQLSTAQPSTSAKPQLAAAQPTTSAKPQLFTAQPSTSANSSSLLLNLQHQPTPALYCSTFNISQLQLSTAQPTTSANPSPQLLNLSPQHHLSLHHYPIEHLPQLKPSSKGN
ncbi:hypothetical protein ElyMa_004349100 [Elysia marginata]|uniref:Uncharacterized protein n=1 Tax=Elysia marginata TaxID=1093978 RepID=A0AAV4H6M4_9GAST|nr:hypothetical protein ElyMa_004349100 [Elysia marginata]